MKKLITDLEKVIKTAAGTRQPEPEQRFHKHREYISYGLKASDFYKIMKEFRPRFLEFSFQERLELAEDLLSQHIGELGHAAIYLVALSVDELKPEHFRTLDRLGNDFRSWSQVDYFCGEVIRPLLDKYGSEIFFLLKRWNNSSNCWKRRASVVIFTRGVGKSGEFTKEVLNLCENLIWDEEDIVQKGVGWALKDNLRSAPEQVKAYVKDLRQRGVSSTITLYAIRDLKGKERKEILQVRKRSGHQE